MVYMSGSKAARNQASLVNRPTCGGPKKAGIVSRQGFFIQSNVSLRRAPQSLPLICVPNYTIQTQSYGYRATIGGNMG
uniref:Uncharacterized protein n=1 Tax=viral metagenome TaxID=1070528 RepID=A0A6C0JER1_9ZZZZ